MCEAKPYWELFGSGEMGASLTGIPEWQVLSLHV